MEVMSIVNEWDYKPTYYWGGTTLYVFIYQKYQKVPPMVMTCDD